MNIGITCFVTDRSIGPAALAVAAEERGYSSLFLPEHTHLPVAESEPPALVGGVTLEDYRRTMDPFVALGAAAAVTRRLELGTGVCLVAQHDPWVLAKQVATLDHLSGGRVVLGVGYGWNRIEAADHGIDFARRRHIAAEKLRHMRALWSQDVAHGAYSWPKPQRRVPVLFGAGPSCFEAIAELGDGWMPVGGSGMAEALPALRDAVGERPVRVVPFGTVPDEAKLAYYAELGVTEVVLRIASGDESSVLRQLDDYIRFLD